MELYKIDIKDTEFKVAVANTPELRHKGLSSLSRLGQSKGMLFIFPDKTQINMVMRGMSFSLDFIFIDSNWKITQLGELQKDSSDSVIGKQKGYMVLEVPYGTIERLDLKVGDKLSPEKRLVTQYKGVAKFKTGGTFEMVGDKVYEVKVDDIEVEDDKMQILNTKGEVVSNVSSGATVFSREHTDEMIKKYKAGNTIGLADSFIKIIKIQANQKQDYVKK